MILVKIAPKNSFRQKKYFTNWKLTFKVLKNRFFGQNFFGCTFCKTASSHSIFLKTVFYSEVLEFLRPSKFLCQTSGRQKSLVPNLHAQSNYIKCIENRAVSGVFRTINLLHLFLPASVSSPRTKWGRDTLAGRWGGGGGQYFGHWIGLLQYNPSTPTCKAVTSTEENTAGCGGRAV